MTAQFEGSPVSTEPKSQPTASLARSALWNWGSVATTMAVAFVLSPIVVNRLGARQYGIWVLLGSLVGYAGLLDFGVRGAVTRYVARLHAEAAHERARRLVSTALTVFTGLGALAVLLAILCALFLVQRFNISAEDAGTARVVLVLGGFGVAATLLGGAFGGIVVGLQRFDIAAKIDVVANIVRALAVYTALNMGYGLVGLATVQLVVAVGLVSADILVARHLYPELRARPGPLDRSAVHDIVSFSFYSTLFNSASMIVFYSDSVVIGAILPVAFVTYFAIAGNLIDYSRSVIRGLSATMTPHISALQVHAAPSVNAVVLRSMRVASLLILPIGITFLLRGGHFIGLWMGAAYDAQSGRLLRILTLGLIFAAAGQVLYSSLMGANLHRRIARFNVVEACANLGLSVLLLKMIGIDGAAWGTAIPSLCMSLIVLPWYARGTLGIGVWEFYVQAWIRPIAANIAFALATFWIAHHWNGQNVATFMLGIIAVLPLSVAGAWFIALDREERDAVLQSLRRRLDPLPADGVD